LAEFRNLTWIYDFALVRLRGEGLKLVSSDNEIRQRVEGQGSADSIDTTSSLGVLTTMIYNKGLKLVGSDNQIRQRIEGQGSADYRDTTSSIDILTILTTMNLQLWAQTCRQ
jgi:hypothetical protein